jgi:hypothetical protein
MITVATVTLAVTAPFGSAGASPTSRRAAAEEWCVGGPGCFATVQAAVDAAHDGDTIRVGAGSFTGGITIDKSVSLIGASAAATRIQGGGPVVTIGEALAPDPPTVSIRAVTITGGFNDSKPESRFGPGFFTAGGGVLIQTGATVTISDSVITGNRVTAGPPVRVCSEPPLPSVECSFASGGGIGNWGTLMVTNTRVAGNVSGATATSGGLATDARGGGIWNAAEGTVTLRHSFVTGNRSAVAAPNGRWAEGGGILDDGTLRIEDSVISGNRADASGAVPSSFPYDIHQEAVAGGVKIAGPRDAPDARGTIIRTTISHNRVTSVNVGGDASATSGGIDVDGPLLLVDSGVVQNTVQASVPPESGNLAGAVFGGIQVSAVATIRTSSINHNVLTALSANGVTVVAAGGIGTLSGHLTLDRTLVIGNRASANGVTGLALGGGILNIQFGSGPPELALSHSVVTANQLDASPGITPKGGGIYTADFITDDPFPITLTHTVVAGNHPDQCFGC